MVAFWFAVWPSFPIRVNSLENPVLAVKENIHTKMVSKGKGRSSISITLDLYSHALTTMQHHAVNAVANLPERD